MPTPALLSYRIHPRNALVYVSGTGEAQSPEWIALFDRVLADPAHRAGMDFLIDRTRDASHGLELGRCRVASITGNDAVFGLHRMASVFAEETTVTVQVFRDRDSAYRWLRTGLDD